MPTLLCKEIIHVAWDARETTKSGEPRLVEYGRVQGGQRMNKLPLVFTRDPSSRVLEAATGKDHAHVFHRMQAGVAHVARNQDDGVIQKIDLLKITDKIRQLVRDVVLNDAQLGKLDLFVVVMSNRTMFDCFSFSPSLIRSR